jgi:hypothetical protein
VVFAALLLGVVLEELSVAELLSTELSAELSAELSTLEDIRELEENAELLSALGLSAELSIPELSIPALVGVFSAPAALGKFPMLSSLQAALNSENAITANHFFFMLRPPSCFL